MNSIDTSEQYIKMCQGLSEFKERKFKEGDYFAFDYAGKLTVSVIYNEVGRNVWDGFKAAHKEVPWKRSDCIWLPRQDQLQDIFLKDKPTHRPTIATLIADFYEWLFNRGTDAYKWKSMEQLWLAFTMGKLFHKIWNGEEWEKISVELKPCPTCGGTDLKIDYALERYNVICQNPDCKKHGLRMGNAETKEIVINQWNYLIHDRGK